MAARALSYFHNIGEIMAYTFTETTTFTMDSTFDSLYTDSLSDLEGGTVVFDSGATADQKKQTIIKLMNGQNYHNMKNIIVSKDGVVCMYVQGKYEKETYTWMNVLVGKINNSKAWTWTSEFHEANKTWIQSIGGSKFALECIKNSRIDTYFTQATTDNVCLGNLTTQDLENNIEDKYIISSLPVMKLMIWEY
ncbi:hypothetical protein [uncultured Mediterranean phage uvMED]|nr:hypothetical protein [uncultured Mediterranean phage uvMED]